MVFIENNVKTKNKPAVVKVIQLQDTFEKNDVHMFLTLRFMDAMHLNVVCAQLEFISKGLLEL